MACGNARFPIGARVTLDQLDQDLHDVTARLRATEPVSWLPCIDGWFVTTRATAIAVMRDDQAFTVDDPRFSTGQVVGPSMLSLDGTEHLRHRSPFVDPYRPANLIHLNEWIDDEARRLVALFEPDGTAELRTQLAGPLAGGTIHRALALDGTDPDTMLGWYRAIVDAVLILSTGGSVTLPSRSAMAEIRDAVADTVRADPDSVLARIGGEGLSADELAQNTAIVMFGAIETAEAMTANALFHLLTNPHQLAVVKADRSMVANAVEESLRLEPAASVVDRYATVDVCIDGADIDKGDLVRVSLAGANRDPGTFTDPDRFDVGRANARQNVTFAHGPHACIGLHLARMETASAVSALLDQVPSVRLSPGGAEIPRGLIFRKPPRLVATWS